MLSDRVFFLKVICLLYSDFLLVQTENANQTTIIQSIATHLLINTTSCSWQVNKSRSFDGHLTNHQFGDKSLNNGPHSYGICHFHFKVAITIYRSAVIELTGKNGLAISSSESIIISSNLAVEWTPSDPPSETWLGGFCTRLNDGNYSRGVGPGGARLVGTSGAGHGWKGGKYDIWSDVKYGWSYGYNTSHVELVGGSSASLGRRMSAVSCGGGAVKISSTQNITVDAIISTNANSLLSNDSCIGGGSGGTIIIEANKVLFTTNGDLFSRDALGTRSATCHGGSGSGGVIVVNGDLDGIVLDPHKNTGSEEFDNVNGVVIVNGKSLHRLPYAGNGQNYIGCYRGPKPSSSVLPEYEVTSQRCKSKCLSSRYCSLHKSSCICLDNLKLISVNESFCTLRCSGNERTKCGGKHLYATYYSVYEIVKVVSTITPSRLASTSTPSSLTPTNPSSTVKSAACKDGIICRRNSASKKLQTLETVPITKNNSDSILKELQALTNAITILSPDDLNISLSILEKIVNDRAIVTNNINESTRIGQNVLSIADRLLDNDSTSSWNVVKKKENKNPEILLKHVEDIVKILGSGMKVNETLNLNSTNFGVRIEVIDPLNFRDRSYTFSGLDIQKYPSFKSGELKRHETVFLPSSLVDYIEGTEPFSLNLLKYQPGSILEKAKIEAERAENKTTNSSLDSNIIAISLSRPLRKALQEHVILTFPQPKDIGQTSRKSCRFLDFQNNLKTTWSKKGCKLSVDEQGNMKCSCNHFTHFAVLVVVDKVQIDSVHSRALLWITYLGCGISLVCLVLTLITFVALKTWISDQTVIHCHLVVSLTLAQIIFIFGITATERKIACTIIAILLHYFYLAAIFWMCVEGVHLYRKVVKVFIETNRKKYYYVFGWGAPAVVVVLSVLTRLDGYGNDKACWLSVESGLIWAFVAPVLGVMAINMIILVSVIRVMLVAVESIPPHGQSSNTRAGVKGIIFLLPILGLTWLFGVLAVNRAAVIFQYVFTILNSFQGFLIFMFHCVFNSEVRAALRRRQEKSTLQRSLNEFTSKSKEHKTTEHPKTRSTLKRTLRIVHVKPLPQSGVYQVKNSKEEKEH